MNLRTTAVALTLAAGGLLIAPTVANADSTTPTSAPPVSSAHSAGTRSANPVRETSDNAAVPATTTQNCATRTNGLGGNTTVCIRNINGSVSTRADWTATSAHSGCIYTIEIVRNGADVGARTVTCAGKGSYYAVSNSVAYSSSATYFGYAYDEPQGYGTYSPNL